MIDSNIMYITERGIGTIDLTIIELLAKWLF